LVLSSNEFSQPILRIAKRTSPMSLQVPVTDDTTPLFSASLVSPDAIADLPEGYTCRPLQRSDYAKGFLDVLRVLTTVGDVTEEVRETF
jgi:glucosamine-phosphate N-acetyltransferase